jgi:SAM-dependent methyltransferase
MKDYLTPRETFDSVASLYNEIRPTYPDELFSSLMKVTGLLPGDKVLEIGPGTGQATKPLAMLGFDVLGIELGTALTSIAVGELKAYPTVRIVQGDFENITLPQNSFDLVVAATSFHWINPDVRFAKPHALLKDNKYLAIIHTHHISDDRGDIFFKTSLPIFDRFNFVDVPVPSLPPADSIKPTTLDGTRFRPVHFQCFRSVFNYSADDFCKLLNTYSNHLAASSDQLEGFLAEIRTLINNEFNGRIEKHFLMSLTVAQKI